MLSRKNKEIYLIKTSLIGNGSDYHVYNMSNSDYAVGFSIGFVVGFIILQIFFESIIISSLIGIAFGMVFISPYRNYLITRRKKKLLFQFRDFLETISASYLSGKSTIGAFKDALGDMKLIYDDNSDIIKELGIIILGLNNNINIEELLLNFASRSELDDVMSFANVFAAGNRRGGNIKNIIYDTREIINDKIDIEMEIQTIINGKRNELYIMVVIPLVVILALKGMGDDVFSPRTAMNIIIRIVVLIISIIALFIGKKITNIKV